MCTFSNLSEKRSNGTYIKGNFKKEISVKYWIDNKVVRTLFGAQETVVRDFFHTATTNSGSAQLSYTIQKGDDKRLRNGILRVYNINEPIDIPIANLLGKWNNKFIGVTLVCANDKWCIKGKLVA